MHKEMKLTEFLRENYKLGIFTCAIGISAGIYSLIRSSRSSYKRVDVPPTFERKRAVHVLFGSQTGTAESFAKELVEEAIVDLGLEDCFQEPRSLDSITDFTTFFSYVDEKIYIILLLSTYGEGDPSDDASSFNEWLINTPDDQETFGHIQYAIFGLGNKQYALYNEMAKRTDKHLKRMGATKMASTGFGDDNADIEHDFSVWRSNCLWKSLLPHITGNDYETIKNSPNLVVRNPIDKCFLDLHIAEKRSKLPFDATVQSFGSDLLSKQFFASNLVPVAHAEALCRGKAHVNVDISKVLSLKYRSGDTLEILPINKAEDVRFILSLYGLETKTDHMMTFTRKKSVSKTTVKKPFPTPCNVHAAVQKYLDLNGSPSRAFIRDIALVCGHNTEEAEKIADDIKKSAQNEVWTVTGIIRKKFPQISNFISFSDLIQLLPKQKCRAYSICSSPLVDPKQISIVVSRVDDHALASVYLTDEIKRNDLLSVTLRQGAFRLPTLPSQPIIMVAVGTGIAPFRAFLAELKLKNRCKNAILFFGCRVESEWIYRSEMEEFKSLGGTLHVAFSRGSPEKVVYVQDLIRGESDSLKELIRRNAVVYVCGSTGMGLSVMKQFDLSIADVADLRTQKRYFEELWG